MTAESLLRICDELGIKLALKGDSNDRLQVDAPKRALTPSLREALTANKPDLIAILKNRDQPYTSEETLSSPQISEVTESRAPSSSTWNSPELSQLSQERFLSVKPVQLERTDIEINELLSGSHYDAEVIDSKDSETRQIIAAQLLAALAGVKVDQQEHARLAFMNHGYFDDVTRQLRTADSPAERAAAARKLGVVRDSKATAHLIASLHDSAPEVRKASAESLGRIGDRAAIPSLNDLLLRETSRQLPQAVIRHAIDSMTIGQAETAPVPQKPALHIVEKTVVKPEPITKKREIFAEYLNSFEKRESSATTFGPPVQTSTDNSLQAAEKQLRQEEEALRNAADALERKQLEVAAARTAAENQVRMEAEKEAQVRIEIEARARAEEEARRRMAEDAARQEAEKKARARAEQEARGHAEEEARLRAEEQAQFRLEAETLRKAAEELARKRSEAEAARKFAEQEAHQRAEEEIKRRSEAEARARAVEEARLKAEDEARVREEQEAKHRAEEEARVRAVEEARRRVEEEVRRRAEEEVRRADEEEERRRSEEEALRLAEEEAKARVTEQVRLQAEARARALAEEDAKLKAQEDAKRRAEEELRVRAAEEANRQAEQQRVRGEAEELHFAEQARLRMEQETLLQVAAELSRRRSDLDQARENAEAEARLLVESQERAKAEEDARRQMEIERQRLLLETRRRAEEEQLAELRRRAAEEQHLASEQARIRAEEEERHFSKLEAVRKKAEEEAKRRAEQEDRIKAEIFALSVAEEEQRRRIEAEIKRRNEAEARLKAQQARAEEEALKMAEELRSQAEEQARRRAELEAHLKGEEARLLVEQAARAKAEEETRRLAEQTRLRAEEEARRRAELETRLREEEARLQAEQQARAKVEEEARRLVEKTRVMAEEEARRRAELETRLRDEEARLQAEEKVHAQAEEEARRFIEQARATAQEGARLHAESELRLKNEEARLRAEVEARLKDEHALSESKDEADRHLLEEPFQIDVIASESSSPELAWVDVSMDEEHAVKGPRVGGNSTKPIKSEAGPAPSRNQDAAKEIEGIVAEKGITSAEEDDGIPPDILKRLKSSEASERAAALGEVVRVGGEGAFSCINRAFDDESEVVRRAAALALFDLQTDHAATFTRALREGSPERRRQIGHALAASGLASNAIANLTGESREKTYDAFSLLFLMAKAGEVQPLIHAIEDYPSVEVRIAVVKLLALSGQAEIVPAFRRLAVRGSLPSEVRSAVMEAIYQISNQARESAPSAA